MLICLNAIANDFDQSFYEKETNISREEYIRDSLFITHTSNEFFKIELDGFYGSYKEEYERYLLENDSSLIYRFVPVKIFYNKDYKKLYSYVIAAVALGDSSRWPEDYDHFTAFNLMGFRDSICSFWNLYPYDEILLSGAPNLDTLIHDLNYFYFEELKNTNSKFSHNSEGKFKKNNYNLDDEGFWENYPDLIKDNSFVDSLYGFQFKYNNPSEFNFKNYGFIEYSKMYEPDASITKIADSLYPVFSTEWNLYIWHRILDSSVTIDDIKFRRDSLTLLEIKKNYDLTITMQDIIKMGIDIYTYKPEIDSVRYPDSLLKMYECK